MRDRGPRDPLQRPPGGLFPDPLDKFGRRRGRPILDVHRDLDEPRARQVEAERAHPGEAAARLAHGPGDLLCDLERPAQIDVESDERESRADDYAAGPRVELLRPEIGPDLARIDPPLQLARPAAAVERRPALGRPVEKHGQPERAESLSERDGHTPSGLQVAPKRHDRNHVGSADPRVGALVEAKIDSLSCDPNAVDERLDQLGAAAEQREHRAVVVGVGMHVDKPGVRPERRADHLDRRSVAALREVRHRFEHVRNLRPAT
jgi:hypothetical protein